MSIKGYSVSGVRSALKKNERFMEIYSKLVTRQDMSDVELRYLLSVAVGLLSMAAVDGDSAYFGYAIIVRYTNHTQNYEALYDVARAHNYMPLVDLIERVTDASDHVEDSLDDVFMNSLKSTFYDSKARHFKSQGQLELINFVNKKDNAAVVAPTSYGKSEMIVDSVITERNMQRNVVIVVPTKALVTQVRKKLYMAGIRRVITHPDMYVERLYEVTGFAAVVTQERLLSLLTKNKHLIVHSLFIDEAHNMLGPDERSLLLSQVILIARNRNSGLNVSYFTPFVSETHNLTLLKGDEPDGFVSTERMKVERFYFRERGTGELYLYDQFLGESFLYRKDTPTQGVDFVKAAASNKNIVYLNLPRDVSRFAVDLSSRLDDIEMTDELKRAMKAIASYTNPLYNIIACLRKGVLFHHGGMPDVVKMYVEELYASGKIPIKFLVTNSTLLEGVNIPANRLFILNSGLGNGALDAAQFKNLSGRVARYSEVFHLEAADTRLLEPAVLLVNDATYERGTLKDPRNFFKERVRIGKLMRDDVENPLLEHATGVDKEVLARELSYLGNIEEGISLVDEDIVVAQTPLGKACFQHSIRDFDIIANELKLTEKLNEQITTLGKIDNSTKLFEVIENVFIKDTQLIEGTEAYLLKEEPGLIRYHRWFLDMLIKFSSLSFMIRIVVEDWKNATLPVFVGKMGDIDGEGNPGGRNKNYAYVNQKNPSEKVGLAISKIKVNQDTLENCLMKYVEALNDVSVVDEDYYNLVKYHTTDKFIIALLKQGASHELAVLLSEKYSQYVIVDEEGIIRTTIDKSDIVAMMDTQDENEILKFEFKSFI